MIDFDQIKKLAITARSAWISLEEAQDKASNALEYWRITDRELSAALQSFVKETRCVSMDEGETE